MFKLENLAQTHITLHAPTHQLAIAFSIAHSNDYIASPLLRTGLCDQTHQIAECGTRYVVC